MKKPKRPKARKARLDADRTAKPRTRIVAHVPAGKAAWPHNVERYELKDQGEDCDCIDCSIAGEQVH